MRTMQALAGKHAIITGASSGIGTAIAQAFAAHGANLFLSYRSAEKQTEELSEQLRQHGVMVDIAQLDLGDKIQIGTVLQKAREFLGQVDVLVNNAGADILTGEGAKLERDGKMEYLLSVDLAGTMQACWTILPIMQSQREKGVILNMSWEHAMHGLAGLNAQLFSAAKAGITGFSCSLAKSCDVRVNVLAPGWINTRFARDHMKQNYYRARLEEIPVKRFGTPQDVAATAVFLASDAASYISGATINISGGSHI